MNFETENILWGTFRISLATLDVFSKFSIQLFILETIDLGQT
jgi:hypothetical protein